MDLQDMARVWTGMIFSLDGDLCQAVVKTVVNKWIS